MRSQWVHPDEQNTGKPPFLLHGTNFLVFTGVRLSLLVTVPSADVVACNGDGDEEKQNYDNRQCHVLLTEGLSDQFWMHTPDTGEAHITPAVVFIQVHYVHALPVEAVVLHFRLASSYPNLSHTGTVLCLDCKEILLASHEPYFRFLFPKQCTSFTSTTNSLTTRRPTKQQEVTLLRGRGFSQAIAILTFGSST